MARNWLRSWTLECALFALALGLYAQTWSFDFTGLDDTNIVLGRAATLSDAAGISASFTGKYFLNETAFFYRPLVNLSFVLDAHVGGTSPWTYHLTNGFLHALACALLFAVLRRLDFELRTSVAASLLFACHPMHTGSVAWIPGRNDLLLGCFTLGALFFLLKCRHWTDKAAHLLCFVAALLCKETAVCLPLAFATVANWGTPRQRRSDGLLGLAWVATLAAFLWLHEQVVPTPEGHSRTLLAGAFEHRWVWCSDLGKVVFPYHFQVIATAKHIHVGLGISALLTVVLALVALRKQLRPRVVLLGVALVALPLALALLASSAVILETRLYVPILGMSLLVAECLRAVLQLRPRLWPVIASLVGAVALTFATMAVRYTAVFANSSTFAQAAIRGAPGSYLGIWLLGQQSVRGISGGSGKRR